MFREMRRKKQQLSNEECIQILKEENRCVLAVNGDDGYPYAIPMNFYYDEESGKIYFHGAKEGHKIDAVKKCSKVSFTTWSQKFKKEDDWAWYVASVVIMGRMELIDDMEIVGDKFRKLAMKYFPDKEEMEETYRLHVNRAQIMALNIEHMTGKLVHEK